MTPNVPQPTVAWVNIYMITANLMLVGCLYHAIKVGLIEYKGRASAVAAGEDTQLRRVLGATTQVVYLCFFVGMYWLLESAALLYSTYYVYPEAFADLVPLTKFGGWKIFGELPQGECLEYVRNLEHHKIPLSVLLMEASLTYTGMWTAILLDIRPRLIPVFGGLFVLVVDALLDPVVARSYDCVGDPLLGVGPGIGLWNWYLPTVKSAGVRHLADWFGVPLFNYAAWYLGPLVVISLAMAIDYFRGRRWGRGPWGGVRQHEPTRGDAIAWALVGIAALAFFLLYVQAPRGWTEGLDPWYQGGILSALIVVGTFFVFRGARDFKTRGRADANLTLPPIVFLAFALVALLLEGFFLDIGGLIAVGVVLIALGAFLVLWPYEGLILALQQRMIDADRLLRVSSLGFPALVVLTGGFSVAIVGQGKPGVSNWQVAGLLTAMLTLHIFAYVLNDVVDIRHDRPQQDRERDQLVSRRIRYARMLALALVQIPAFLLVTYLLGAPPEAALVGLAGFALMAVYDVYGKRIKLTFFTDLARAFAWGSLAPFAALTIDLEGQSDNWFLVAAVFVFGAGFSLLSTVVYGGLRGFARSEGPQPRTTAIALGVRAGEGETVVPTRRLQVYALVVHTLVFVMPAMIALDLVPSWAGTIDMSDDERCVVGGIVGVVFLLSTALLIGVVWTRPPRWGRRSWVRLQAYVMWFAPLLGFATFLGGTLTFLLFACYLAPLLASKHAVKRVLEKTHPNIHARLDEIPQ